MREALVKTEEFKDSPVGRIPKDWRVMKIGEACSLLKDGTHLPPKRVESGPLLLSVQNMIDSRLQLTDSDTRISWDFYKTMHRNWEIQVGDVLMAIVGATLGKTAIVPPMPPFTLQRSVAVFRGKPETLKNLFLYLYLSSETFQRLLWHRVNQTAQPGIYLAELAAFYIPLPSLKEQESIAEILDTLDKATAHTSSLIAKLKQMKAGLLHDLLTRGLDENGELRDAIAHSEQFKDSQLGRIPKDWEVVTVADIATDVTDGDHHTPERSDSGVFLLSARNVLNGYLALEDVDFVPEDEYQRMIRRCNPEPGDILISCSGTIGRVCEVPANFRCVLVRSAALVKLDRTRCQSRFIEAVLQSDIVQSQILMEQLQAAQPNLFQGSINRLRFALPPLNEQERISEIIDTHNNRIRTEEAYRDKLKLQKQGLMHDLLTGKVRVKNA